MRFTYREKGILYREVAKLLEAGFPMERALDTLHHHPLSPGGTHLVRAMQQQLASGHSIGESIEAINDLEITEVEKNLIHAGERSGQLADVFQHLADYFERLDEARHTVLRGLFYPAVLLHLAVVLLALPEALTGEGWRALQGALLPLAIAYLLFIGTILGYRSLQRQSRTEPRTDRLLSRVPLLGKLRRMLALQRFTEVFRIYLLSAFKPSEAIEAAGDASQSAHLRRESSLVSRQLLDGRDRLGSLLLANGAFPKEFAAGMSTAEESGTLDKELLRWSKHYSGRARDAFSSFEIWLPRLVYFTVSGFLVWKVVSCYFDYFDSITSLL